MSIRQSFILPFARRMWHAALVGALISALSSPGRVWAVEPWPEMPLPPKADAQWIAQSMRVNGVPTRVMQFHSRASRKEIVAYYSDHWSSGYEHKPSVRPLGDATVINQGRGPYLMTVKVEDDERGTSHGLISVARVLGSKPDIDPGQVPLMPAAHVLSVVESDDVGKHSRQVLILTPQSPASASEFYRTSFTNNGWKSVQGSDASQAEGTQNGSFLVFVQGAAEMQLSIVQSRSARGSTVLANLVTKDTGPSTD